jgi:hypothetical protein
MATKYEYRVSAPGYPDGKVVIENNGQINGLGDRAGNKWYVSRDVAASGNGSSWAKAFKTIGEAVSRVNADYTAALYPSKGRNTTIYIGEGYYTEAAVTLTANDCAIIAVASGHHDSVVLYVTSTTTPALKITGSNNTIYGLGVVNVSTGLQPAIQLADGAISNSIINCSATKDVVDSCKYGIEDLGNAYTYIEGFEATTSCSVAGIRMYSATNNGIQQQIKNSLFYGTPSGILVDAASHQLLIQGNTFMDDTSDTADTVDTPILNNGGTSIIVRDNYAQTTTGNLVTGAGSSKEANNFQLA